MPVVLRVQGYRFEFYASDADEPRHVHVKRNGKHAKVWLEPIAELAYSQRCRPHEVNEIMRLVRQYREQFIEDWNAFFGHGA
jgi:hypothetical protein